MVFQIVDLTRWGAGRLAALQTQCDKLHYKIAKISRKMQIFWHFFNAYYYFLEGSKPG